MVVGPDKRARDDLKWGSVQFSAVIQSCPTLCDPVNCSTSGLPVHHQLPEFTQLMSITLVMPSSHLIFCRPLLLLPPIPPSIRAFSNESVMPSNHFILCRPLLLLPPIFPSIRVFSKESAGTSKIEETGWSWDGGGTYLPSAGDGVKGRNK